MGFEIVDVFRVLTACSSMMMILSPSPAVYRIYKHHEIGYTSIISLVSVLGNCHMWMMYGYLSDNIFPVFVTFGLGDFIALIYISIYYKWTPERQYCRRVIAFTVSFLGLVSIYAFLGGFGVTGQTKHETGDTIGYIAVCVTLVLYSSPFEKIKQVLKHKSAVFIPITMVVAGSTNNFLWVIYTPMDRNWFMLVTNAVCLTLGIAQLCVYYIYHPKKHPFDASDALHDGPKNEDHNSVSIVLSPTNDRSSVKFAIESPSFSAMHSPLAPLHST